MLDASMRKAYQMDAAAVRWYCLRQLAQQSGLSADPGYVAAVAANDLLFVARHGAHSIDERDSYKLGGPK